MERQPKLKEVIDQLTELIHPEKIFLLGLGTPGKVAEHIFRHPHQLDVSMHGASHFYLLIITRKHDKRPFYELHEFVEKRCKASVTFSIFIEQIHVFDEWLIVGHPFARRVIDHAVLLYDAGTSFSTPVPVNYFDELLATMKEYKSCNEKITEFIAGAELFNIRRQFGLAAFMLHQAAEYAYTILIKAVTGYRLATHNLARMIRFVGPFSPELACLFPRNDETETRLFQQFQNSYIEARYRQDFVMTEEEISLLLERVKKLQVMVKNIISELREEPSEEPKTRSCITQGYTGNVS